MAPPAAPFSTFETTRRFDASYSALNDQCKKQADKAIELLFNNPAHPGLAAHPIKPDKYYREAYLNRGDRIIYRAEGSHLVLVDIVKHDDIGRYGKAPAQ